MNTVEHHTQLQFAIDLCDKWWHLGQLFNDARNDDGHATEFVLAKQGIADRRQIVKPYVMAGYSEERTHNHATK